MSRKQWLSALVLLGGSVASAAQIHVSNSGNDVSGTGTPANPVQTIARGVQLATLDGDEVMLEPGTYSGPGNQDVSLPNRAITIRQSDMPGSRFIQPQAGSRAFEITSGAGRGLVIRDIAIVGATRTSAAPGGVPSLLPGYTPQNNPTSNINVAGAGGGGVFIRGSSPTFSNVFFALCNVDMTGTTGFDSGGGAIYMDGYSYPLIEACTFNDCKSIGAASYAYGPSSTGNRICTAVGGAIAVFQCGPEIQNCAFAGNAAIGAAAGAFPAGFADGGAICLVDASSYMTVGGCTFANNSVQIGPGVAGGSGGAISSEGGVNAFNCTFTGNSAKYGGGLNVTAYDAVPNTTVSGTTFSGNQSQYGGLSLTLSGPYRSNYDPFQVANCLFRDHTGAAAAPVVYCLGDIPVRFTNTTFTNNNLPEADFIIAALNSDPTNTLPSELIHCTVAGNTSKIAAFGNKDALPAAYSKYAIANSIFSGNVPKNANGDYIFSRGGNIFSDTPVLPAAFFDLFNTDPMLDGLVDLGGGILALPPLSGSAAIDHTIALLPEDVRGRARPYDGDFDGDAKADSGAVEYVPAVTPTPMPTPVPGDFDNSGCVDVGDFLILLDNWQLGPTCGL